MSYSANITHIHLHSEIYVVIGKVNFSLCPRFSNETLIRSVDACPTWEDTADAHLLKLQSLQNRVPWAIENLDRCTPDREMLVAFKIYYVYDYANKQCGTQAEVILHHVNSNLRGIGQGEAMCKEV
jgi:hypothetical protein